MLRIRGILCLFDPWIRDPGMGERNNPDLIFESLETIFWGFKILKFFYADPESGMKKNSDPGPGMEKIRIRDKQPGSATLDTTPVNP